MTSITILSNIGPDFGKVVGKQEVIDMSFVLYVKNPLELNNMITEDYVSFETAKLLKEKGFNEQCYAYYNIFYDNDGKDLKLWRKYPHRAQPNTDYLNVPTLQTAMKWLREIYKLEVRSTYDYDKDSWWGNINPMFEETDENSGIYQKALGFDYQGKSYEEACEVAIKYCLENLI